MIRQTLTILLVLFGLSNLAFAFFSVWDLTGTAKLTGFAMITRGGYGEFRAVYTGLVAAVGALLVLSPFRPEGRAWLQTLCFIFAGLACGRILSLALDGSDPQTVLGLIFEGAAAAATFEGSRRIHAAR
ncbi:MAG: DUF4345 family protein [Planctomycetota bacterium]